MRILSCRTMAGCLWAQAWLFVVQGHTTMARDEERGLASECKQGQGAARSLAQEQDRLEQAILSVHHQLKVPPDALHRAQPRHCGGTLLCAVVEISAWLAHR